MSEMSKLLECTTFTSRVCLTLFTMDPVCPLWFRCLLLAESCHAVHLTLMLGPCSVLKYTHTATDLHLLIVPWMFIVGRYMNSRTKKSSATRACTQFPAAYKRYCCQLPPALVCGAQALQGVAELKHISRQVLLRKRAVIKRKHDVTPTSR